jgi:transitional endoplasmic reticulum ATPase
MEAKLICQMLFGRRNVSIEIADRDGISITEDIIRQAIADFMPPQERDMIAYMNMLAIQETSRRSLLPMRYQNLTGNEVLNELNQLRQKLVK